MLRLTDDWQSNVVTDPDAGVFYAISDSETVYRFEMDGSAVQAVGLLTDKVQAMALGAY